MGSVSFEKSQKAVMTSVRKRFCPSVCVCVNIYENVVVFYFRVFLVNLLLCFSFSATFLTICR